MSLRTKLLLWNSGVFVVAILLFGALQIVVSRQAAMSAMDRELRGRALGFLRGPMRPPPNQFSGPGALGGPPRQMDVRRPRAFSPDGSPLEFNPNEQPWDSELLAKSSRGTEGFSDITWNGQGLRVYSVPVATEDRRAIVQVAQETDSLRLAERAQITAFSVVLPLVALVAAVLAALLSRLVIGPVSRLTLAAEKIARDPDVRERISGEGSDEMSRLSNAFDTMTDRLQESNTQLRQSLESQKRFTGDAAHELRTPLTSISLAAENALHKDATSEEKEKSLQTVLKSAQSMQALTSMLLSLSRLDSATKELLTSETDVFPILKTAVTATGLDSDKRLRWDVPEHRSPLWVAPDAVLQIVTNLLENAAAYTPADGSITVRLTGSSIEIEDTGEGIPPEHLTHVFERFYRADPARSRSKGGHGLGLAICKSLAEAQGADLTVSSNVGKGTVFRLAFAGPSATS